MDNTLIIITRILLLLSCAAMIWWSTKSLIVRCRLKICEFSDFALVTVGLYWLLYNLWGTLINVQTVHVHDEEIIIFSMRFGLLLTIIAFTALIKDRLLVSTMYEALMAIKEHKEALANGKSEP